MWWKGNSADGKLRLRGLVIMWRNGGSATPDQLQSIRVSGGGGGCQAPAAAVSGEINAKPSLLRGELFVSDTSAAPGCLSFLCLPLTIATAGESLWSLNAKDEKIVLWGGQEDNQMVIIWDVVWLLRTWGTKHSHALCPHTLMRYVILFKSFFLITNSVFNVKLHSHLTFLFYWGSYSASDEGASSSEVDKFCLKIRMFKSNRKTITFLITNKWILQFPHRDHCVHIFAKFSTVITL